MGERLWNRVLRVKLEGSGGSLTVGTPEGGSDASTFEDVLTIEFDITKTIGSKQNTGSVVLYNLTRSHRAKLGKELDKITVEAGYKGGLVGIIGKGDIRDVKHERDNADIKSTIEWGDGDKGLRTGVVSKTFPSGTKPKAIVDYLAKALPGVDQGEVKGLDDLPAYKRPVTVYGFAHRELDEQGRTHRFHHSVQNGKFEAVKDDKVLGEIIVLSQQTGLLGIPEVTDKGLKCTSLMNARIAPNRAIDVHSQFLDEQSGRDKKDSDQGGGVFRVSTATFSGGNRKTEFEVAIEATRADAKGNVKKTEKDEDA